MINSFIEQVNDLMMKWAEGEVNLRYAMVIRADASKWMIPHGKAGAETHVIARGAPNISESRLSLPCQIVFVWSDPRKASERYKFEIEAIIEIEIVRNDAIDVLDLSWDGCPIRNHYKYSVRDCAAQSLSIDRIGFNISEADLISNSKPHPR